MTSNEQLEEQIMDLQARLAYQEDTLQVLNDTVAQQDKSISLLKLQLSRWQQKLDEMSYSIESSGSPTSERPPHY